MYIRSRILAGVELAGRFKRFLFASDTRPSPEACDACSLAREFLHDSSSELTSLFDSCWLVTRLMIATLTFTVFSLPGKRLLPQPFQ